MNMSVQYISKYKGNLKYAQQSLNFISEYILYLYIFFFIVRFLFY